MLNFHIISLFPESLKGYTDCSILKRAQDKKLISFSFYDPKHFEPNKKLRIDGKPYGGGPGMVMRPEPLIRTLEKARGKKTKTKVIYLSPQGKQFTDEYAQTLAKKYKHIIIVAGRYEGIDARVKKIFKGDEVSVGPYVLSGGELPALTIADATARKIPGVLGNSESLEETRTASKDVYTRPADLVYKKKTYRVPKVLSSGHHQKIEEWRNKHKTN